MSSGTFVAGLLFTAIGLVLLLERLDVWEIGRAYVWPVMLIALGVAVLLGSRARRDDPPP